MKKSAMGARSFLYEIVMVFYYGNVHYDGIGKLDVLLLVDSTEHLFFSFEFAKPFVSTQFLRSKYQYGSEFSQIGTPHFSLEGVLSIACRYGYQWCY